MPDLAKLALAVALIAIAGAVAWFAPISSILAEVAAMALVSASAYLAYDALSSMRVLARRRARQRAKVPAAHVLRR